MRVQNSTFAARIAMGVWDAPDAGETTWEVVEFVAGAGRVVATDGGTLDSKESPEDAFEVLLSLAADDGTWAAAAAGGADVLIALMAQKRFDVKAEGQAAFFVRHLPSILEATLAYSERRRDEAAAA